jgi:hypothetical protein
MMRIQFSKEPGRKCSGVITSYNCHKILGNFCVYIEFELLEVKVPRIFLVTVGFSLRRDGR